MNIKKDDSWTQKNLIVEMLKTVEQGLHKKF